MCLSQAPRNPEAKLGQEMQADRELDHTTRKWLSWLQDLGDLGEQ